MIMRILVSIGLVAAVDTRASPGMKDVTSSCTITMSQAAREASFVVVYSFETAHGKPAQVRKLRNEFLDDFAFTSCISSWELPSFPRGGMVEFVYKATGGWMSITISDKDRHHILHV